jgi:hypothetical protein
MHRCKRKRGLVVSAPRLSDMLNEYASVSSVVVALARLRSSTFVHASKQGLRTTAWNNHRLSVRMSCIIVSYLLLGWDVASASPRSGSHLFQGHRAELDEDSKSSGPTVGCLACKWLKYLL